MSEQVDAKKKEGIGKFIGISFLFIIVLVAVFIALLKFDVAGLGTQIIGPKIMNIPGASLILPEMPVEDKIIEGEDTLSYETMEQVVEILKVTENLLKEKEKDTEKLIEQIDQLQLENGRLKVFEANFMDFESDKESFDNLIVAETNSEAFSTWYAKMNPDNAAKIYAEVIGDQAIDAELKDLVLTYAEMKPAAAAAVLSEMSGTRLEMVATIIKHLEADEAAKILGAMDSTLASRVTAYLYPEQ